MSKFTFRLDSVLKLKVQMEEDAKNQLANATKILVKQEEYLDELKDINASSMKRLTEEMNSGISVSKVVGYNHYFGRMKTDIEEQKENVNLAQRNVDINRGNLVKAVQNRKILDKLKENKYQEYLIDQNREEQHLIDELNSFKYKDGTGEENGRD